MTADPTADPLAQGLGAALREFVREPLNLGLVLVLPPLFVHGYGRAMENFPSIPFMHGVPQHLGVVNGAMAAAAFLPGIIGLFQVISARQADGRLSLAGFGQDTLFAARFATVGLVAAIASAAAMATMLLEVTPDAPMQAYLALVTAGLLYGLLGMLVGAVLPRELEGSLVLVFITDMDAFLSSGIVEVESPVVNLFPLQYPHRLYERAVFDGSVAATDAVLALLYLLVLGLLAIVVYARLTENGGVGS